MATHVLPTFVLDRVSVVSDGLVLIVDHKGRRFGVPTTEIRPGSTVRKPGDHGRLVISRSTAARLGLR
jgi:hypothetical protein